MKRRISPVAAVFVIAACAVWTARLARGEDEARPSDKVPAEKFYKNIKVFKGMPSSQLHDTMRYMANSLGVSCAYCHVSSEAGEWSWEKDDKKMKKTAREMVEMVREVNKSHFDGKTMVSCATCHQGAPKPAVIPPLKNEVALRFETLEEDATPEPGLPGIGELVASHAKAVGGKEAFAKLTSRESKGVVVNGMGHEMPIEILQKSPDKMLVTTTSPRGADQRGTNGTKGWMKSGQFQGDMDPDDLADFKREAALDQELTLDSQYSEMKPVEQVKLGDKSAVLVAAKTSAHKRAQLYFDSGSGLLVRTVEYQPTPLGDIVEQTDYEDFRDIDGVKLPFVIRTTTSRGVQTEKLAEVHHNSAIDDSRFDPPAK